MAHHGEALARESGDALLAEAVASGRFNGLDPRLGALCAYAFRLTRAPATMSENDLIPLRAAGIDDRAIVDANQVGAYFNYVNRIAHGLGVELEPAWSEAERAPRHYPLAAPAGDFPAVDAAALPWLSVEQMRLVDRMTEDLGITLERMMENAGHALALVARHLLGGDAGGRQVRVLAGPGGNGGGGMAAARHLALAGAKVDVWLGSPPERLASVTAAQFRILQQMGVRVASATDLAGEPELVLDALLGYSQSGGPRGEAARLIAWSAGRRVLALDVPSGLELSTGRLHEPHVRAEGTLTLALPKEGLGGQGGRAVGDLFVADISVPQLVYERLDVAYSSPFGRGPIVRVTGAR